jgi:NhaP-type Na+/H+ or K+/H+ antiporter
VVLAIGGTALAFMPHAPQISLDPELVLALFVAPILLDASFDTSPRDLRKNWLPVGSLVFVAVGVTTAASPSSRTGSCPACPGPPRSRSERSSPRPTRSRRPRSCAACRPPHRIVVILEGESLLNDATALLIYRLAVGAVAAGSFSTMDVALPVFGLVVAGSLILGAALAWPACALLGAFHDPPSAIILQFITTFGVWILAERLHLSGIITIVVYGITLARLCAGADQRPPAHPLLCGVGHHGLRAAGSGFRAGRPADPPDPGRPERRAARSLTPGSRSPYSSPSSLVRLTWVMTHNALARRYQRALGGPDAASLPAIRAGLIISWCGMRGIVTLAAGYALPADFPYRDLILVCAFTVVVGTLLIQGLTLPALLKWLALADDRPVEREFAIARKAALEAALRSIDGENSTVADAVRREYHDMLAQTGSDRTLDTTHNELRRNAIAAARTVALELRRRGTIGDDAFHRLEEELDWLELGAAPREAG